MSASQLPDTDNEQPEVGFDYQRLLHTIGNYWYVFAISIVVALAIAKWYTWYAIPKYNAHITMLIKDEKDAYLSAEKLLQQLEDNEVKHNMSNEIEILKSRSIMSQVIDELNLNTSYFSRKRLKKSDLYKKSPIVVSCDSLFPIAYSKALNINIIDTAKFEIGIDGDSEVDVQANFGDVIHSKIGDFKVNKTALFSVANYENREYLIRFTSSDNLIEKYTGAISVDKISKESTILRLELTDVVMERAVDVLDKLCQVYLRNDINHKNKVASSTLNFIDDQLSITSADLKNIEANIERFKTGNRISTDIPTEANLFLHNAHEADMNMSKVRYKYNVADYIEKFIKGNNNLDDMSVSIAGIDEPQLERLIDELRALEAKKNQYSLSAKADNPLMIGINFQLDKIRESIINSIAAIKRNLALLLSDSEGSIRKFENQIRTIPGNERQLIGLKRQFDIKEQMYLFLLQKRSEISIARSSTVSDSHVVDSALGDGNKKSPVPSKIYTIAFLLSVVFPFLFFYLKTMFNKTISSKEILMALSKAPLLGVVNNNDGNENTTLECMRAIRTNLHNNDTSIASNKVIVITSTFRGEGKTYLTNKLANIESMAGKKTIVVCCNMNNSATETNNGLSNVLRGKSTLKESIISNKTNVDILPAGTKANNAAELLLSNAMHNLIIELSTMYDLLLLDTPSVGIVSDTLAISKYANATIVVTRENYTEQKHISFINSLIVTNKINNVMLVFNDVQNVKNIYGFDAETKPPVTLKGITAFIQLQVSQIINKIKK
jgi:tyrosine-protein kinase Etk/Wzc